MKLKTEREVDNSKVSYCLNTRYLFPLWHQDSKEKKNPDVVNFTNKSYFYFRHNANKSRLKKKKTKDTAFVRQVCVVTI